MAHVAVLPVFSCSKFNMAKARATHADNSIMDMRSNTSEQIRSVETLRLAELLIWNLPRRAIDVFVDLHISET